MSAARGDAARVIWLSDLHYEATGLVLGHDPRERLAAAVDHVNQNYGDADLCLITGDLVDTQTPENYLAVRAGLNRLSVPWWPLTGNHDDRAVFLDHMPLPEGAMPGFAQYVIELDGARLICLDSLWEGESAGELCPARLTWLKKQLDANRTKTTLIFLHHPPVPLGLPMLDPVRLSNGDVVMALLQEHPNVRHICCGHVHRPVTGRMGGIGYTSLRATLYQAPPPVPAWDWDSFEPAAEAPELGVITVQAGQITIRTEQFCPYEVGRPKPVR